MNKEIARLKANADGTIDKLVARCKGYQTRLAEMEKKPSQRHIEGTTEYQCEHRGNDTIADDCVWCMLSVAETGMKKQREMRQEMEKRAGVEELRTLVELFRTERGFEPERDDDLIVVLHKHLITKETLREER